MARVRMVTRTVELTVAKVLQIDVSNAQVSVVDYELSGKFDSNEAIIKVLNKDRDDTIKVVNIESIETKEVLYGMPEADFIKMASILPPRTVTESEV